MGRIAIACLVGAVGLALPITGQAAATPTQVPHLPWAPVCQGSAADPNQPTTGQNAQSQTPAPGYFAADLPTFTDTVLGRTVGGFGGLGRGLPIHHTPVIFVHGNQADAQNWLDVMLQFQNDAGYTMEEMYALSYGGLENYYAAAPVENAPTSLDTEYVQQNPKVLSNGGHGYADDDQVPQLCRFVELVQWYTGSAQVDIVAHSLGVTIARRFMELYPSLARDVAAFVGIAGANHGTSVCRGLDTSYYGCNEIAPGTAWLADLNAHGESPGPARWMTVLNGSNSIDPLFADPQDWTSPELAGADNRRFPTDYHNDLRVGHQEVDTYLPFLLRHGQAGPGAAPNGSAQAAAIEAQGTSLDGTRGPLPTLCGVPRLTGGDPSGCPTVTRQSGTGTTSSGAANPATAGAASAPLKLPNTATAPAGGALIAILPLIGLGVVGLSRRRAAVVGFQADAHPEPRTRPDHDVGRRPGGGRDPRPGRRGRDL